MSRAARTRTKSCARWSWLWLCLCAACASAGPRGRTVEPFTPVDAYSAAAEPASDTPIARYVKQLAEARGHALALDPRLEQLARFAAERGEALPPRLLELAARQLGVYDAQLGLLVRAVPGALETSQLPLALEEQLRAQPFTHFGAVYAERQGQRVLVLALSLRRVWLEPVPSSLPAGSAIVLRGRVLEGYRNTRVELLSDGARAVIPAGGERGISVQLPAARPGLLRVEIFAEGALGTECLARLPVYVDTPFPRGLSILPHERHYDFAAVAQRVFTSMNRERARAGLPALTRDARLDALALAHSVDMRDHDFVGHSSARSGDPLQRVAQAGLPTTLVLETIARGSAPEALEASPTAPAGELRNLLSRSISHVGIGITAQYDAHGPLLIATELFAELPEHIEVASATPRLLGLINAARVKRAAPTLVLDPGLGSVALEAAQRFVNDASATEQRVLADADRELGRFSLAYRRVNALLVTVPRLDDAAQLEPTLEVEASAIGIGIAQGSRAGKPVLVVVLTLGTPRR